MNFHYLFFLFTQVSSVTW